MRVLSGEVAGERFRRGRSGGQGEGEGEAEVGEEEVAGEHCCCAEMGID